MWFFNKKTEEKADETLEKRLLTMNARIFKLESEVMELATAHEAIRQRILKKAGFGKKEEEQPKDLYGGMLLAE